ncbi:hypothetical protein JW721_02855 [Candidatus Micrarchaeota archaeon]|nr:hypothetical protein [Candidatus Micrarchaeota archaeon]
MGANTPGECFEQYPAWIILASNLVSLGIYAIGAYILYQIGTAWMALYLLCALILEIRLLKKSCTNCYYYGKPCAFGKGRLASLLFKKGKPEKFSNAPASWAEILPDLMVSLIPLLAGIALLIAKFDFLLLLLVLLLFALSSAGNGFIRGSLACRHCRQRELGCPAEKLFNKKK